MSEKVSTPKNQNAFLQSIHFSDYYYPHEYELESRLIINHLCALESQKNYVYILENVWLCDVLHLFSFKSPIYVLFLSGKATLLCELSTHKGVRPDALVDARLPVETIFTENFSKTHNCDTWFCDAVKPYSHRIDEIAAFRRTCGQQVLQSCLIWLLFRPPPTRWKIKRQFLRKCVF